MTLQSTTLVGYKVQQNGLQSVTRLQSKMVHLSELRFCAFTIPVKQYFSRIVLIEVEGPVYKEVIKCCHTFFCHIRSHKLFLKQHYFHAFSVTYFLQAHSNFNTFLLAETISNIENKICIEQFNNLNDIVGHTD